DARLDAMRAVTRRLIARGQSERAIDIATQSFTPPRKAEAVAMVGLDLISAGDRKLAERAFDRCKDAEVPTPEEQVPSEGDPPVMPPPPSDKVQMPTSVKALALIVERQANGYTENPTIKRLGQLEADARKGEVERARAEAARLPRDTDTDTGVKFRG